MCVFYGKVALDDLPFPAAAGRVSTEAGDAFVGDGPNAPDSSAATRLDNHVICTWH